MTKHAKLNSCEFVQVMNEIDTLRRKRIELLSNDGSKDAIERVQHRLFELTNHHGYTTT